MVESMLRQYGGEVMLGEQTVRGLLQPVTGKLERLARLEPGPLGLQSRQQYIYIGPLEPAPMGDMVLCCDGKRYTVRSAHRISGPDGPLYSWAICVEKGGSADGL